MLHATEPEGLNQERPSEVSEVRLGVTGFYVFPLGFGLVLIQNFLGMPPLTPFGMELCILFHGMLEVRSLSFDFTGHTVKRLP